MGFMDKVKAQTTVLAEKAQAGAKAGQEKLGQMQAKRQSDALLLELGGIVYLERQGRAPADSQTRAGELVARLQAFETEHGAVTVTPADPQPGETGSFIPGSAGVAAPTADNPPPPPPPSAAAVPGGVPASGGIPQSSGGIPTASYSSDDAPEEG